ncbi:MAG: hypothetical protein GY883_18940 [Shimia sp.]|nr:hypothetical protein [Shimia sp.]
MATETHVFDGATPFTIFGSMYNWFNGNNYGGIVSVNEFGAPPHALDVTFSDGPWRIETLLFYTPNGMDVTITDSADGFDRDIEYLRLSDGNHAVSLTTTEVKFIRHSADTGQIDLQTGVNTVRAIDLSGGNDRVTTGVGRIEYLDTGQGDDTVTLADNGRIIALRMHDGADVFHGSTGADSRVDFFVSYGGGDNVVNVGRTTFESLNLHADAGETATVNGGSGDLRVVRLVGAGTFNFDSGTGRVENLRGIDGNHNLTIGDSGSDAIVLGSGVNSVMYGGTGYSGNFTSYSGNNTLTIGANAQVRTIGTSNGVDELTVHGRFDAASLGAGNDVVTLTGSGRGNTLDLGDGDNRLQATSDEYLNALVAYNGDDTVMINNAQFNMNTLYVGGGGQPAASFSRARQ